MRCPGVFKVISKKYIIDENDNPKKDGGEFNAEIEFEDDLLQKTTMIPKNKDTGELSSKIVLIEALCDDEVVSCYQADLKDYAGKDKATFIEQKIEDGVAKVLSFNFDVVQQGEAALSILSSKKMMSIVIENEDGETSQKSNVELEKVKQELSEMKKQKDQMMGEMLKL